MADFSMYRITTYPAKRKVVMQFGNGEPITMTPEFAISIAKDIIDAANEARSSD